jgi:hypothetical protein
VLLLLGAIALQQCTDHGEAVTLEKIQFNVGLADAGGADGRLKQDEVPDALLISLENSAGELVVDRERITLLRMGDGFITEPLELPPGSYRITDFMLVKGETQVLYATPRQGSLLSTVVKRALPYRFALSQNKVSNIDMEVIDVRYHNPEDFGYEFFPGNEPNVLDVGIFIQPDDHTFTDARAYLLEGTDTVKRYDLEAGINEISFAGDPLIARRFVVVKPGYDVVVKEFIYTELIAALNGQPWKIELVPSVFTLVPRYTHFEITLEGKPGTLSVDWGDGSTDTYTLSPTGVRLEHNYGSLGTYLVAITGDLEKIEYLYNTDFISAMNAIGLQSLSGLRKIRNGFTECPAIIDLSHNYKLESVVMPVALQLQKIILPENSIIRYLDVNGPNQMTAAAVDQLIDQVYAGVEANNTTNGTIYLYKTQNVPDDGMLGPPSPDRMEKLIGLKHAYGWNVEPVPF